MSRNIWLKVPETMDEIGASFVITGEVLGQRPMSQHRQAIELIERESGLAGLILRPPSAHLFPPTLPEMEGIVDREKGMRKRSCIKPLALLGDRALVSKADSTAMMERTETSVRVSLSSFRGEL